MMIILRGSIFIGIFYLFRIIIAVLDKVRSDTIDTISILIPTEYNEVFGNTLLIIYFATIFCSVLSTL